MTTLTINLESVCAGGNHMAIGIIVDAQQKKIIHVLREELLSPLSAEEISAAVKVIIRMHARGKTAAQVKNNLTAGIVVTA